MTPDNKILKTISEFNMFGKGDKVLAAVSGGADSVCMLHMLCALRKNLGFELACAHLNHGLRGEDAEADAKFVEAFCKKLDVPFFLKKVDVAELAKEGKLSTEEAGRKARYDFFNELKEAHGFTRIATAHNKNDNAETVLMRIIRGSGLDGLSGIPYIREDNVVRPLLDVSRQEIEEYCKKYNLEFCTDATNLENDYTRNKVRNLLIPFIEKEFNTGLIDSLNRLSKNASQDSRFVNEYAKRLFERLGSPLPGGKLNTIHIESFKMVDDAIRARILRMAAEKAVPEAKLEHKHISELMDMLDKPTGTQISLPMGITVRVNYGWLTFEGPDASCEVCQDDKGFFAQIKVGETLFVESIGKEITLRMEDGRYKCKINEAALDPDVLGSQPLFIRNRRDGDRIVWFPDGRTKKIKNVFIDEKIDKKDREKIPLLCTGDEVVAIIGGRVSEKYKLTKESERALVIEYGKI